MLDAIEYLHKQAKVVHRDLKPENLLLSHDYRLKIADFGLSARLDGDQGTGIHYSHVGTRQYQAPEVLEQRSYRGDRVDIFSMGVILFTMVTGAMPYLSEASVTDPLYRLILRRCRDDYWSCWRTIRESNKVKKPDGAEPDDLNELVADTTITEDIKEAICNCLQSFTSSFQLFLCFILNILKFVFTLGKSAELFENHEVEIPKSKYEFSQEFKSLVFDMMAYDHKQRPTLDQIRNHPWMLMEEKKDNSNQRVITRRESGLRREVEREMTKVKQSMMVKQIQRDDGAEVYSSDDQTNEQQVNVMPSSFYDFLRFQYNTSNSTSNFSCK